MTDAVPTTPARKRVRLAPAVRKRLIIDAALTEFAAHVVPQWDLLMRVDEPVSGSAIDAWIDLSYTRLADPAFQSVFRILIAESQRIRHLVGDWRRAVLAPQRAEQQRITDTLVAQGNVQRCTLTEHSELTLSPLVHALLVHLIDGDGEGPHAELAAIREAHRRLRKEQLAVGRPVDAERAGHGA